MVLGFPGWGVFGVSERVAVPCSESANRETTAK